jgi:hypothetical protein
MDYVLAEVWLQGADGLSCVTKGAHKTKTIRGRKQ